MAPLDVITRPDFPLTVVPTIRGKASPNSIFLHPPDGGSSHVAYDLTGHYSVFTGQYGIQPTPHPERKQSLNPLVFRIIADGKELLRSPAIRDRGSFTPFRVNVKGVKKLELFVDLGLDGSWATAVWVNPIVATAK